MVRGNPVVRKFCLARLGAGALPPHAEGWGDRNCISQCPQTGAVLSAKPKVVGRAWCWHLSQLFPAPWAWG